MTHHFSRRSCDSAAEEWLSRYPWLTAEGCVDPEYVEWYGRMLEATGPTGLLAAACYWEPPPGFERFRDGRQRFFQVLCRDRIRTVSFQYPSMFF
jgi:hypothetical protein